MAISERDIVLNLIEAFNKHDIQLLKDVACDDALNRAGGQEIPWSTLVDVCETVFQVFPDIKWTYNKLSDDGIMDGPVTVTGTHTGGPFGIGPYPPIDTTGIKCTNLETWKFTFENGKIKTFEASGEMSGPPGFYLQIGGKL